MTTSQFEILKNKSNVRDISQRFNEGLTALFQDTYKK